jgi:peptidoglycan LD-endopeptidase LytH
MILKHIPAMKRRTVLIMLGLSVVVMLGVYVLYRSYFSISQRTRQVFEFLRNPQTHQESVIPALTRCGDAPFILPTTGLIGFLWDDSFRPGHRHQGIDIFSGTGVGQTPVYAAYEGYLTRLPEWKSTVIIRIPSDPLQPDRQIWTYYTHMADESGESMILDNFPAGINEVFIEAGTMLGYQGNYSGTPDNPTGVHLHFSIVKDDGQGKFLNELEISNTLDPSPYFGMSLNGKNNSDHIPACP